MSKHRKSHQIPRSFAASGALAYLILAVLLTGLPLAAQEASPAPQPDTTLASPANSPSPDQDPTRIGLLIGSLRPPYSSLYTGLDLQSGSLGGLPLKLDFRLQSQGTFLILNPQAFDAEVAVLYDPSRGDSGFAVGLGYKFYGRFSQDERSDAQSSYAPFLRADAHLALLRNSGLPDLDLRTILDASVFGDGFSLRLHPQLILGLDWFYAALDLDTQALFRLWGSSLDTPDTELRFDSFVQVGVRLH